MLRVISKNLLNSSFPCNRTNAVIIESWYVRKILWENNSSVWLESNCPGTERNRRRTSHSKRELSFSEVVVEVSCQKPSVARFWQAVTKTKEKESYLEECEKFAWDFGLFQDIYFLAIQITFFLILEILQKSRRSEFQTGRKHSKKTNLLQIFPCFNITYILVSKFLGVPLKIAGRRPAIFQ